MVNSNLMHTQIFRLSRKSHSLLGDPRNLFYHPLSPDQVCSRIFNRLIISFQCTNLQRAITPEFFLEISPGNHLTILYQLTEFEAASCNRF